MLGISHMHCVFIFICKMLFTFLFFPFLLSKHRATLNVDMSSKRVQGCAAVVLVFCVCGSLCLFVFLFLRTFCIEVFLLSALYRHRREARNLSAKYGKTQNFQCLRLCSKYRESPVATNVK